MYIGVSASTKIVSFINIKLLGRLVKKPELALRQSFVRWVATWLEVQLGLTAAILAHSAFVTMDTSALVHSFIHSFTHSVTFYCKNMLKALRLMGRLHDNCGKNIILGGAHTLFVEMYGTQGYWVSGEIHPTWQSLGRFHREDSSWGWPCLLKDEVAKGEWKTGFTKAKCFWSTHFTYSNLSYRCIWVQRFIHEGVHSVLSVKAK